MVTEENQAVRIQDTGFFMVRKLKSHPGIRTVRAIPKHISRNAAARPDRPFKDLHALCHASQANTPPRASRKPTSPLIYTMMGR